MSKTLICLFLIVSAIQVCRGQESYEMPILLPNESRELQSTWIDNGDQEWHLGADVTTFFRDAEFSTPYTRGYTATGFFLTPYGRRNLGHNAALTLGLNLNGAAGYDGIHSWQPLVRLTYQPSRFVTMVMGSIYGNLYHQLDEPMFDRERYIYAHHEEGVQFLVFLPYGSWNLSSDTWVHWEDLLEPWQPKQERFTLGTSNRIDIPPTLNNHPWQFSIPFNFLGSHRGGQFTALDTCIESLFNESVGLRVSHRRLAIDLTAYFYQDISPQHKQHFDRGYGFWPHVTAFYHNFTFQAGYWYGYQFIAPRGSYLFQSVSWHKPDFAEPIRQMATAKLTYNHQCSKIFSLGFDIEGYYDIPLSQLDLAFGLYMRSKF